jgi:hypothetical protein
MDVDYTPFFKVYESQLQPIQRHFGEYIKHIHRIKNSGPTGALPNEEGTMELSIKTTSEGFPIFPDENLAKLKKHNLEQLMRDYLGKHYSMSLI